MTEPTVRLVERLQAGDARASGELLERVYGELHALARRHLAGERAGHTLQPTALVHEAFLRLARAEPAPDRTRFFATAARAMRQVLVDHARARQALKRDAARVELAVEPEAESEPALEILALDEALAELEQAEPRLARVIELHYFTGLESGEIALVEGLSERSVRRELAFARAWLRRRLDDAGGP
jgi:RNA polymerase sigma-70 factor, ECF subfamily